jgi:PTH1 family peptidyl-tRNA hydrolase
MRASCVWTKIAEKFNFEWSENKKFNALIAKKGDIILLKPLSFMNNSGVSSAKILHFYKLLPKKLLITKKNSDLNDVLTVIHDDLDINLGDYKIS